MNLSENLKYYRQAKKLTQEQAADALFVSPQTVSRWECGTTLPDVTKLPELAKLYCVTIDELFHRTTAGYDNYAQRLASVYEATRKRADFFAAVQEFDRLVESGSYSMDDLRTCGIMYQYMMMDCKEQALYWFDRVFREAGAEDGDILLRTRQQRMRVLALCGQADLCVEEQKKLLEEKPEKAESWVLMLVACLHAKQYEDACSYFSEAAKRFPEEWELYIHASHACRKLGLWNEALAWAQEATRLRPDYPDGDYEMAFCYADMGDYEAAGQMHTKIAGALRKQGLDVEADRELLWANEMYGKQK